MEVLELLLDFGADINGSNRHRSNPLLLAVEYGHLAMVKALVDRGANLDCEDNDGDTPLILALDCQHKEITEYLIDQEGIDVVKANNVGETPMTMAAFQGYRVVIERLQEMHSM